ncbi:MAG: cyclic nucleotide-binding domain-containing protein [Proteobacteria bacterium]|nr:cyclic nucleotide-binding domain-containing protein [Pseudomonadota bacterium]
MATLHLFRNAPEVVAVAAGKYIFRKGEAAKVMYLIIEGEVELMLGNTVVETAGEGSFIGEMALIEDEPRSASARARGDCRVFPINEARFQLLVKETPFFALQLMKILARRLRNMDARASAAPKAKKAKKAKKKT